MIEQETEPAKEPWSFLTPSQHTEEFLVLEHRRQSNTGQNCAAGRDGVKKGIFFFRRHWGFSDELRMSATQI